MSSPYDEEEETPVEEPQPVPRRRPRVTVAPQPDLPPPPGGSTPLVLIILGIGGLAALVLIVLIVRNLTAGPALTAAVAVGNGSGNVGLAEDVVPGSVAADFVVQSMDGKSVRLSDYRGKNPVWLNFWASWCNPCKAEMPDMETIYQEQQQKHSDLVMLGFDVREPLETVQGFVQSRGFHWLFLVEPGGATADRYVISGIPTHVFIDRNGVIKNRISSGLPKDYMEQQLGTILNQ